MKRSSLTFARVLRAVLRQDPDVLLVGEMRDAETAEIGTRAAITGHLVLSTLHTRDAMSTPVSPARHGRAALHGVYLVAGRYCAATGAPELQGMCWPRIRPRRRSKRGWSRWFTGWRTVINPKRGMGCSACNGTGYSGRQGVYELLEMDAELDPGCFAVRPGGLYAHGPRTHERPHHGVSTRWSWCVQGRTSLAEALRIGFDVGDVGRRGLSRHGDVSNGGGETTRAKRSTANWRP
jgi:MSHA biogenesis protein MshE